MSNSINTSPINPKKIYSQRKASLGTQILHGLTAGLAFTARSYGAGIKTLNTEEASLRILNEKKADEINIQLKMCDGDEPAYFLSGNKLPYPLKRNQCMEFDLTVSTGNYAKRVLLEKPGHFVIQSLKFKDMYYIQDSGERSDAEVKVNDFINFND